MNVLQRMVKKGIWPEEKWKKKVTVNSRKAKRVLKKFKIKPNEMSLGLSMLFVGGFLSQKQIDETYKNL